MRPAAFAGAWYPSERAELDGLVAGFLDRASPPALPAGAPVRAIIVPHAGYEYSGPTAGFAYRALVGRHFRRVIVLGPSHHVPLEALALPRATHFATPLGEIPLDVDAMDELRADPLFAGDPSAHAREHSVEMQLPLLQKALAPGWKLVPIVVGELTRAAQARAGALLRELVDADTLVVVSSDFTHYGANYDFHPFPLDAETPGRLHALDFGALEQIQASDADALARYRDTSGITACGYEPIMVLLGMLAPTATVTMLRYDTSGQLGGDYTSSVSYLALAVTSRAPLGGRSATRLTYAEMQTLHRLALRALSKAVADGADEPDADALASGLTLTARLRRDSGAFVTLKERGDLRGCIGSIQPVEPLYEAVVHNAASAALHDTRFDPVRPAELASLEVEVSVLSPMQRIASYEQFQIGRDGVVLARDGRRAVFLPEVAAEQGWDRPTTLSHLSVKAGLAPDAWREGTEFWVFTSQVYDAPYAR